MNEHEKRASEGISKEEIRAIIEELVCEKYGHLFSNNNDEAGDVYGVVLDFWHVIKGRAHTAGFEAGLKARLPSREEFDRWVQSAHSNWLSDGGLDSEEVDSFPSYLDAYDWLAANMRKGDV